MSGVVLGSTAGTRKKEKQEQKKIGFMDEIYQGKGVDSTYDGSSLIVH